MPALFSADFYYAVFAFVCLFIGDGYQAFVKFSMMVLMSVSVIYSIGYLRNSKLELDIKARFFASTGMVLGLLGITTGAIWANYTWGAPWSNDIKQILAAVALLIYAAYFVLRNSF